MPAPAGLPPAVGVEWKSRAAAPGAEPCNPRRSPLIMTRIGILTGGGDVPGLNPCIKTIVTARRRTVRGRRASAAAGPGCSTTTWTPRSQADCLQPLTAPTCARSIATAGRTCIPPHQPRQGQARRRAASSSRARGRRESEGRRWTCTPHMLRVIEHLGIDALVPIGGDDTLSLRRATAPRRHARDRDPQDDGQRRLRHRLLHRLLDRGDPQRRVHPRSSAPRPGRTSGSPWSSCSGATAARRR